MLLLHLLQVRSGIQVGLEQGSEEEVFAIVTASRSCATGSWWCTTSSDIIPCCSGCSSGHVRDPSNGSLSTDITVGRLLTLVASQVNPKLWLIRELFPTVLAGDNAACGRKLSKHWACLLITWFYRQWYVIPQTEQSCCLPLCITWWLRKLPACVKPHSQM